MVSDNPESFADLDGHGSENVPSTNTAASTTTDFWNDTNGIPDWYMQMVSSSQNQQAQQQLSAKSQEAIDQAFGKGSANALLWGYSFLRAGAQTGVDPNILVGLAVKESSLNPNEVTGEAKGMFQITPGRQEDLGLSAHDLSNPNVVTGAVARSLTSATKTFNGNSDLAIASWTVGVGGTRAAFNAHGMEGVRNLLLDRAHPSWGRVGPQYIDPIKSFQ